MIKLRIPRNQRSRLRDCLRKAGRKEIGGFMMAELLRPDDFLFADFSVDESTGTSSQFVRNPEAHKAALDEFFQRTNFDYAKFNYLGEWHSHPSFSTNPSMVDILTMQRIVDHEPKINFSALMIVRLKYGLFFEASAVMFRREHPPETMRVVNYVKIIWI